MAKSTPTPTTHNDPYFSGSNGLPMGFGRPQQIARYLGISVQTLYRWEREGQFPKRNRITGMNCALWRWTDVHAWTDSSVQAVS
jgi:predicted DNA-binding transcriptional regulator AlpA